MTNRTSAQMWPFVWRQCRRTTPRAPDRLARTCMSLRRSMPILLWGFVRRAASALARCYCVGVANLSTSAAASAQSFRRIRLPCALALLSAPLWLGKRRRCPNRCAELRTRSLRPRARAWLAVWPSSRRRFCLCCAETMLGSTEPASLRRLQRRSDTRFGTDQRAFEASEKF